MNRRDESISRDAVLALGASFLETVSPAQRKTEGIFYTPDYIVRHIVDHTLGGIPAGTRGEVQPRGLSQITRGSCENVKVLDPACGAGAFLVRVFDVLLAEHQRVGAMLNDPAPAGEYARRILRENIYGVDLNQESVEITKLSLWLRSGISDGIPGELDGTIKCGNSLIEDPAVAGRQALRWPEQFPGVMAAGGFDVIVGNPPYVNARTIKETDKAYLREHYPQLRGAYDLYVAFLLRGQQLLSEHGRYGWIVPNKFLVADYARQARDLLAERLPQHGHRRLHPRVYSAASGSIRSSCSGSRETPAQQPPAQHLPARPAEPRGTRRWRNGACG